MTPAAMASQAHRNSDERRARNNKGMAGNALARFSTHPSQNVL
jgi:hypothetical protein